MTVSIAIVGTGYVGLVTGTCLAELGHDVVCVDNDTSKIDALNAGRIPIYEPGLDELVASNVRRGTLRFSTDLAASVATREAVFIAVGTPTSEGSDHANVDGVLGVAAQAAPCLTQFTVVVTKSTVPVGTNRRVQCILDQHLPEGVAAAAASNPEFLREGSAIEDFMHPDRVVFGSESEAALAIMRRIYAPLEARGHQIVETEIETAEVIKYAANAFLAVKISYINEVAELCEAIGADVERVATGIGLDHRIGAAFLQAGPGWGGSCFPKDTRALRATANDHRVTLRVVDAAISANLERRDTIVRKVQAACGGSLEGKRIAVLGLTFKGQTDDLRQSPSVDVIRALVAEGANVRAYDPSQPHDAAKLLPGVGIAAAPLGAVRGAELLLVLTDWKAFRELQLDELAAHMADPVMVDLRNLYDEATVMRCGFRYYTRIGRTAAPFVPLVRGHRHPSLAAYASIAAANDGSLRKVGASATTFEVAKAAATLEVAFDPVLPEATLLDAPGITATGHVSL